MTHEALVVVDDVHHGYAGPGGEVPVLRGVALTAARGRLVVVRGRSGSGKTTLLNIIGGLSAPDRGRVVIDGQEVTTMDEAARLRLRRDRVGFIFQTFGLLPLLSAAENVGVPLRLQGADRTEREERVGLLLAMVGLTDHAAQRPDELSGGQQQRVAIARALAGRPAVLIADEPTGQLDSETGRSVLELLRAVVAEGELTAIVATHDPVLVSVADDVLELRDGRLHPAS